MNNGHRSRKLVVRSALAASSTIAVLAGAQALMMQDAPTNTADAESLGQTSTQDLGVSAPSTTTIRSSDGSSTSRFTPSQTFPQRSRSSR